ncbi:MAG: hypothetical protein II961_01565 [Candidatus Riflebacteria bacterium]|nr:hypothetical protein [Candidatus Riflebacteria bacterium]
MKKHLLSIITSIVICALLLIGCGGGGGGGNSAPSEPTEFIYSTEANNKGSFRLTSNKSGAVIESSEEGTLATGSSIVLTERLAKSNESKLYGGNSSNVYTLQAKNGNKTIKQLDKPVILTIPNNFGKEFKTFFLGSKSETASDWQYTQIQDDNDTNPTVVKTARLAVKDLSTFKVKTFRLSYSFAIFASKDSIENKPTNANSVKLMTFSADPAKVYYDKNNKYITDIKVSSCITANKSSALFDGSEVTSQLVFFNGNSADLSGLKIDGSAAVQTSSTDKDSSNNQYSHTLYIKSYKKNNITISGNNATYTFELKLSGVSTKDFPDSFRVKTVLKDANGTEFASEGSVKLKKEKEPEKTNTNTSTNTSSGTGTNTKTSTNTSTGTNTKTSTSTGTSTKTSTTTSTNTKTNTSTDTGSNTTTQTTTSTGSETSTDTNTASSTDTGSNTSTTTSSDTNTSSNTQTTTNTDTNTGSGTSTTSNTETNTAINTGSSTETNTQTSTNTASSTDTNSNTNTSTETNTGSNTNTDTSSNTSTETNTQTSTNTDTTSNTDTSTSTGTNIQTTTEISVSISPTNSETTKVEITTPIKITFNEKMDKTQNLLTLVSLICNSTTTNLITASNQLEWSTENNKDVLTVKNTKPSPEQSYTIKLNSGLKTESGLTSTNQISSKFVTRDAVALSVTNLTTQNAPLNTRIEITPTGGTISSIENASINFSSNSKAGSFSIENGKAYFTLTSGTTWNPNTTYTGTINGILDSDGCETKSCSFSFTTRNQTTLAFQTQESYHARSSLAFTVANGSITDLSTANISYSGGSINCSLSSNNGNVICSLGENAQWTFNSSLSITISNLKDSEGAPVANSIANFNIGAQPYLAFYETYINANDDLVFTPIGSTITSLSNATVTFTGATVSGNLELVDGKVVYKLADNSFYPFASIIGIHIRGLKDSNGVTVADVDQGFNTEAQPCIGGYTKSENLLDDIVFSGNYSDWNVSGATAVFDNANVSGTFSIENGKILYKLNTGYNYPPSTRVTGKIKGIKNADGLPVMDCDIEFTTRNQAEVNIDVFNQVAYGKNSRNEKIVFNAPLFDTKNISYENIDLTNARMIMNNNNISGTFSIEENKLLFTPTTLYPKNTSVTAKLTGLKDYEGVSFADFEFNFDTFYFAGLGTEDNPFLVSSADDLNDVREYDVYFKYYKQTANIDLSDYGASYDEGKGWLPINGFVFYYNGNNYKITNLYINRPNDTSVGLFGDIYGNITNLGIENVSITCINGGAIAGNLLDTDSVNPTSIISNCWIKGGRITSVGGGPLGGLFGSVNAKSINNCFSNVEIERTCDQTGPIGGIAGDIGCETLKNCYSLGNISINGGDSVGGFAGTIQSDITENCFSKSNINVDSDQFSGSVGSFVGTNDSKKTLNCYCIGEIDFKTRNGSANVGSFVGGTGGRGDCVSTIINCYSTGNVSVEMTENSERVGGFIGDLYIATLQNCYAGSSEIKNTFGINRVVGYIYESDTDSSSSNCYANKNMTLVKNGVSSQPGLQEPLPETVALDGVDGANLPDNPDWKNDIFKDGYENGDSFDTIWEIGSSGLPILKNMPGNPAQ